MILKDALRELLYQALVLSFPNQKAHLSQQSVEISSAHAKQAADYQCNSAMKLAALLNLKPQILAELWLAHIVQVDEAQNAMLERVVVSGPGFINLQLKNSFLAGQTTELLTDPMLGFPSQATCRVVIDYSSPNIAKEMHVGHLRSTIIGDSLARFLRFAGFDVLSLNHLGDWGTAFGMLIAYVQKYQRQFLVEPRQPTLAELMVWYRQAKAEFDSDPDFKKMAQVAVVHLQANDPESLRIWQRICDISQMGYQEIYDLLKVDITARGESFYNPYLKDVLDTLAQKNLLQDSEGAKCVLLEGFKNRQNEALPLIVQKSDGGFNYATTDLAALRHRVSKEQADWLIYVVDLGQAQHLQMVFAAGRLAGFAPPQVRLDHVAFGLVLGPDGKKFKTRSGDTEKLHDLLSNAIDKAYQLLLERTPDMAASELSEKAKILGINAVKYADLATHRAQDYAFSLDKMLRFEGNTAAFLLYAFVRAKSILNKCHFVTNTENPRPITLTEPLERELALKICQFPDSLKHSIDELMPHRLCEYLFQLAEKFHQFFHHCRVEGSPNQASRLQLCQALVLVLKQSLELLGLEVMDQM